MLFLRSSSALAWRTTILYAAAMTAFSLSATTGYASAVKDFPSTDLPCLLSPQAIGVIILFTGKQEQLDQNFIQSDGSTPSWKVMDDGSMLAMNSNILTKKDFGDILLHVEFKVPEMPEAKGQARGNSGIFIQGCYELQILDSFGIGVLGKTDCGAITNVQSPLFNACKAPKQWQSYDIIFRSPRYDASGKTKLEHAHITAFLNGILVQNNVEVHDSTGLAKATELSKPGPILLQFHDSAAAFRNIWVLPLTAQYAAPLPSQTAVTASSAIDSGESIIPVTSSDNVYGWKSVPSGQKVRITHASFDLGGYQLTSENGEVIVAPFINQNLYPMKFGRSNNGQNYFINDGEIPVFYVNEDFYLENLAAQGAKWYPIPQGFAYKSPIYVGPAANWNDYISMAWYPGMVVSGGAYSYNPDTRFVWMPLYYVSIDGVDYTSYDAYRAYYLQHSGYVQGRALYNYYPAYPGIPWNNRGRRNPRNRGTRIVPGAPPGNGSNGGGQAGTGGFGGNGSGGGFGGSGTNYGRAPIQPRSSYHNRRGKTHRRTPPHRKGNRKR